MTCHDFFSTKLSAEMTHDDTLWNVLQVALRCCTHLSWFCRVELSPQNSSPHVITDLCCRKANADFVVWTFCTCVSWPRTAKLSPPQPMLPHAPLICLSKWQRNALLVPWISCTFLSWCWTSELSPTSSPSPDVTTEPFDRMAANALHVAPSRCTQLSQKCSVAPGNPTRLGLIKKWPEINTLDQPKSCRYTRLQPAISFVSSFASQLRFQVLQVSWIVFDDVEHHGTSNCGSYSGHSS